MAIRKMDDLYFPDSYRLMLDDGKWYIYDTGLSCPVDKVDRRFAFKLINTGFVGNKFVDGLGRLMYSRLTQDAPDLAWTAAQEAYKAGLGVSEWEAFMPKPPSG